ncbi:MAG TPA: GDSL-type esterase/lipase family protein [Pseudonocardiaceae bacterium]|nr:GDSL-type esterase/lipase family protein [Pseudonocardiaceae bacterium]
MSIRLSGIVAAVVSAIAVTAALPAQAVAPAAPTWSASWATSQSSAITVGPWSNETLRMVTRTSLGGSQIRVDLANPFVASSATFGHVTVGVQQNGGTTTATPTTVTFGGSTGVNLPAGGEIVSDPVALPVTAGTRLLVSLYVPSTASISSAPIHQYSLETEYNYTGGDVSGRQSFPTTNTFGFTTFLAGVDVNTSARATVVAIGDSITAAMGTAGDTDTGWPSYLAARVAPSGLAVVNMGVTGDQVIANQPGNPSVSGRWQHDVLSVPGATAVIEEGGINDLRAGVSAATLESAQLSLASSAHAAGLKFLLTTLTPCGGVGGAACDATFEAQRLAYNTWVRSDAEGGIDGYVDFDAALGGYSTGGVGVLNPAYDSGDHIHPNMPGNDVMAGLVPLPAL